MEESKNFLLAIYIMGIKRRPELANKPCILQYFEEERRILLSITVGDSVENISIDRSKIISARNVVRTIMSQDDFRNTSINQADVQILATAFTGAYGALVGTLINKSGLLSSSNSGAVTYSSLNELHITYVNDDNEQRDLILQTDMNPSNIIDFINRNM